MIEVSKCTVSKVKLRSQLFNKLIAIEYLTFMNVDGRKMTNIGGKVFPV